MWKNKSYICWANLTICKWFSKVVENLHHLICYIQETSCCSCNICFRVWPIISDTLCTYDHLHSMEWMVPDRTHSLLHNIVIYYFHLPSQTCLKSKVWCVNGSWGQTENSDETILVLSPLYALLMMLHFPLSPPTVPNSIDNFL